ncbi:MAG: hypothetical protein ACK546_01315 [bacterium]
MAPSGLAAPPASPLASIGEPTEIKRDEQRVAQQAPQLNNQTSAYPCQRQNLSEYRIDSSEQGTGNQGGRRSSPGTRLGN